VCALLLRGAVNKEIAAELNITLRTVKFHISNIIYKLKVASRLEVVLVLVGQSLAEEPWDLCRSFQPEPQYSASGRIARIGQTDGL
jgi:hypothetical protein